jgi:hypothetical protein
MSATHHQVVVEYAQGIRNSDWIGRQDPYIVMTCGSMSFRTKTCRSGGTSPVWHQMLQFPVENENDIHLRVLDDDIGTDALLGTGVISLAGARTSPGQKVTVQVQVRAPNNQPKGFVQLALQFQPSQVGAPSQLVISNTNIAPGYPHPAAQSTNFTYTVPIPPVPTPWSHAPAPVYYPAGYPALAPPATTTTVIMAPTPTPMPMYHAGAALAGGLLLGATQAGCHHHGHHRHHHHRHRRW